MNKLKFTIVNAFAFFILAASAGTVWSAELQLPHLMSMLSQKKWGQASFVEKKYLSIIDKPIVSKGTLAFVAPNFLEKKTLSPKPETLILVGDTLTIQQPGKSEHKVSLEEYPEATAFIESIRGTLAGDLKALEKYYDVSLKGTTENWVLILSPKDKQIGKIFSEIRMVGVNNQVKTIEFKQRDGDHSVMSITDKKQ